MDRAISIRACETKKLKTLSPGIAPPLRRVGAPKGTVVLRAANLSGVLDAFNPVLAEVKSHLRD